jgi:hypothetical protein
VAHILAGVAGRGFRRDIQDREDWARGLMSFNRFNRKSSTNYPSEMRTDGLAAE